MAISESQLIAWTHQGAIQSSANTYNSIKTCIDEMNWNEDVKYDIYLQGSYKNSTNIRGNSDVDIVLELTSTFHHNSDELPSEQIAEFDSYYGPGKYKLADFRNAVLTGLKNYYGESTVVDGNKSIKVKGSNGRLDADVVCCSQYREYKSFSRSNLILPIL